MSSLPTGKRKQRTPRRLHPRPLRRERPRRPACGSRSCNHRRGPSLAHRDRRARPPGGHPLWGRSHEHRRRTRRDHSRTRSRRRTRALGRGPDRPRRKCRQHHRARDDPLSGRAGARRRVLAADLELAAEPQAGARLREDRRARALAMQAGTYQPKGTGKVKGPRRGKGARHDRSARQTRSHRPRPAGPPASQASAPERGPERSAPGAPDSRRGQ